MNTVQIYPLHAHGIIYETLRQRACELHFHANLPSFAVRAAPLLQLIFTVILRLAATRSQRGGC